MYTGKDGYQASYVPGFSSSRGCGSGRDGRWESGWVGCEEKLTSTRGRSLHSRGSVQRHPSIHPSLQNKNPRETDRIVRQVTRSDQAQLSAAQHSLRRGGGVLRTWGVAGGSVDARSALRWPASQLAIAHRDCFMPKVYVAACALRGVRSKARDGCLRARFWRRRPQRPIISFGSEAKSFGSETNHVF